MTSRPSTASGTHFQTLSLLLSFSSRVNYPRTERVWLEKIHRLMCRNRRINRVYPPSGGKKNTPFNGYLSRKFTIFCEILKITVFDPSGQNFQNTALDPSGH